MYRLIIYMRGDKEAGVVGRVEGEAEGGAYNVNISNLLLLNTLLSRI